MKTILKIAVVSSLFSTHVYGESRFTTKEKSLLSVSGGCAAGALTGITISALEDGGDVDYAWTALGYTAFGCLSALIANWIFLDDSEAQTKQQLLEANAALESQTAIIKDLRQQMVKKKEQPQFDIWFQDSLRLAKNDEKLWNLKDPSLKNCRGTAERRFYLSGENLIPRTRMPFEIPAKIPLTEQVWIRMEVGLFKDPCLSPSLTYGRFGSDIFPDDMTDFIRTSIYNLKDRSISK